MTEAQTRLLELKKELHSKLGMSIDNIKSGTSTDEDLKFVVAAAYRYHEHLGYEIDHPVKPKRNRWWGPLDDD